MIQKYLAPRAERIEAVAAIAVGRHPEDSSRAVPGWRHRLSLAMGLSHGAVFATLKAGSSPVFDRKLRAYVATLREQMLRDIETLETIEKIFAASEGSTFTFAYADADVPAKGDSE